MNTDREQVLFLIRDLIEARTGESLNQFVRNHSALQRYYIGLYHVVTTNKAICEALMIPVEAGTRYKAELERRGQLVASTVEFECPYTGEMAHLLSTNPKEFDSLKKSDDTQLKLFE
jgi:hypothetical protein